MQQIGDWLKELGLSEYSQRFVENDIDVSVLPHLTDQDLKELGVSLGHRRKMLAAIPELARRRCGIAARCAGAEVSNADCWKTQPVRPALFLIGPMTAVSAAKLRGTLAFVTQRDGRFYRSASTGRDASATCKA